MSDSEDVNLFATDIMSNFDTWPVRRGIKDVVRRCHEKERKKISHRDCTPSFGEKGRV
jgi:hypothetical protein